VLCRNGLGVRVLCLEPSVQQQQKMVPEKRQKDQCMIANQLAVWDLMCAPCLIPSRLLGTSPVVSLARWATRTLSGSF
jgi:hypothetical protein